MIRCRIKVLDKYISDEEHSFWIEGGLPYLPRKGDLMSRDLNTHIEEYSIYYVEHCLASTNEFVFIEIGVHSSNIVKK